MTNETFTVWIFYALQITLLATIAWIMGAWLIKRRPDLATIPGTAALITGFCLLVLTTTDVPRPLRIMHDADLALVTTSETATSRRAPADQEHNLKVRTIEQNAIALEGSAVSSLASVQGLSVRRLLEIVDQWSVKVVPGSGPFRSFPLWIVVGLGFLFVARFMVGVFSLVRMAHSSTPVHEISLKRQVDSLASRIKYVEPVQLASLPCLASPCVSWVAPRTIFVPVDFESWTEEERLASLAHELAHLKRRDARWRISAELAWAFNCWHPFMLSLRRQVTLAQELSADQLAAAAIGSGTVYRKGLSRLALRLDAQATGTSGSVSFLSTSVSSSSLIRRINMLKGFNLNEATCSPFKKSVIAGLTMAACCWLCCWTVKAQTQDVEPGTSETTASKQGTVPAEGVRVAMVEPESMKLKRAPFSLPIAKPWESLSLRQGYVSVRAADLLEHPLYAVSLPAAWNAIKAFKEKEDGTRASFAEFGLSLDSLERVDTVLQFTVTDIPLEKGANGEKAHTQSISIGADGFVLHASKNIDWPGMVDSLDFGAMGIANDELSDGVISQLKKDAKQGQELKVASLDIHRTAAEPAAPLTPIEKRIWNHVGGGVVTVFYRTGELTKEEGLGSESGTEDEDVEFEKIISSTQKLIHSTAIGVDIAPSPYFEHLRLALEPSKDVTADKLAESVKRLLQLVIAQSKEDDEEMARQFENLEVETVTVEDSSFVVVSGDLTLSFLMGLAPIR